MTLIRLPHRRLPVTQLRSPLHPTDFPKSRALPISRTPSALQPRDSTSRTRAHLMLYRRCQILQRRPVTLLSRTHSQDIAPEDQVCHHNTAIPGRAVQVDRVLPSRRLTNCRDGNARGTSHRRRRTHIHQDLRVTTLRRRPHPKDPCSSRRTSRCPRSHPDMFHNLWLTRSRPAPIMRGRTKLARRRFRNLELPASSHCMFYSGALWHVATKRFERFWRGRWYVVPVVWVNEGSAELRLDLSILQRRQPPLSSMLGPGVDPVLDEIISSVAYVARKQARPVVDSIMGWCNLQKEGVSRSEIRSHMCVC
jgi:hypothetical protein